MVTTYDLSLAKFPTILHISLNLGCSRGSPHPNKVTSSAYLKYCGKNLEGSHTSDADARASAEILSAQLESHDELPQDIESLHQFCCYPEEVNWVDQDGKLIWINDEVAINFGKKYKGVLLKEVANTDPGFLEWILRQDFSEMVMGIVSKALKGEYPTR